MTSSNSWDVVNEGHPRSILLLDNFGGAQQIKNTLPGVVVVGRIYLDSQPTTGDPTTAAQNWWNANANTILAYPDVDYWEGYNEPSVGQLSQMQWYSSFDAARVSIMQQNGVKALIGNFATGTPDVTNATIIEAYYPAIKTAMNAGGILGLHEYSAPYMNSSFDFTTQTGWLTGRYRKLYQQYLIPSSLVIPLLVSENGIDGGTCGITGCNIAGGWKNFCSYWNTPDCPSTYMQQLEWYDSLMLEDNYVIGSSIFCEDISGWDDFDITPVIPDLITYLDDCC